MEGLIIVLAFCIGVATSIGFVILFQNERALNSIEKFKASADQYKVYLTEKKTWKAKLIAVKTEVDSIKQSVMQLVHERDLLEVLYQKIPMDLQSTKRVNADEAIVFGRGKEWVYLYTFKTQEDLAKERRSRHYPMKLGMSTQESVIKRVDQQVAGNSTALSERAVLRLIFRVNDSKDLEAWMHKQLKRNQRQVPDSIGVEWFNTNPTEIEMLFRSYVTQKQRIKRDIVGQSTQNDTGHAAT